MQRIVDLRESTQDIPASAVLTVTENIGRAVNTTETLFVQLT